MPHVSCPKCRSVLRIRSPHFIPFVWLAMILMAGGGGFMLAWETKPDGIAVPAEAEPTAKAKDLPVAVSPAAKESPPAPPVESVAASQPPVQVEKSKIEPVPSQPKTSPAPAHPVLTHSFWNKGVSNKQIAQVVSVLMSHGEGCVFVDCFGKAIWTGLNPSNFDHAVVLHASANFSHPKVATLAEKRVYVHVRPLNGLRFTETEAILRLQDAINRPTYQELNQAASKNLNDLLNAKVGDGPAPVIPKAKTPQPTFKEKQTKLIKEADPADVADVVVLAQMKPSPVWIAEVAMNRVLVDVTLPNTTSVKAIRVWAGTLLKSGDPNGQDVIAVANLLIPIEKGRPLRLQIPTCCTDRAKEPPMNLNYTLERLSDDDPLCNFAAQLAERQIHIRDKQAEMWIFTSPDK